MNWTLDSSSVTGRRVVIELIMGTVLCGRKLPAV
jgi:hypothetical protein